jgi:hypothetical protein
MEKVCCYSDGRLDLCCVLEVLKEEECSRLLQKC